MVLRIGRGVSLTTAPIEDAEVSVQRMALGDGCNGFGNTTVGTRLGLGLMEAVAAMPELPCRVGMVTSRIYVVERPRRTEQWDYEWAPG